MAKKQFAGSENHRDDGKEHTVLSSLTSMMNTSHAQDTAIEYGSIP